MDLTAYTIVSGISTVFLLIAGLYRPLRVRMTRHDRRPFKPLLFYPLFIGAIGIVLAVPVYTHLFELTTITPQFSLAYVVGAWLAGLLGGGLYVLGYEGKAPFKVEALLLLPLLAGSIANTFTYIAAR